MKIAFLRGPSDFRRQNKISWVSCELFFQKLNFYTKNVTESHHVQNELRIQQQSLPANLFAVQTVTIKISSLYDASSVAFWGNTIKNNIPGVKTISSDFLMSKTKIALGELLISTSLVSRDTRTAVKCTNANYSQKIMFKINIWRFFYEKKFSLPEKNVFHFFHRVSLFTWNSYVSSTSALKMRLKKPRCG